MKYTHGERVHGAFHGYHTLKFLRPTYRLLTHDNSFCNTKHDNILHVIKSKQQIKVQITSGYELKLLSLDGPGHAVGWRVYARKNGLIYYTSWTTAL